ncbi:MAG: hypothetical protein JW723_02250 [Bacteroidales bacterium]|nr:hypothetical protein [Bacteroidales bacterium]
MAEHFLVCDYNPKILKRIRDRSVVFFLDSLSKLYDLESDARDHHIHIHCVIYETKKSLSDIIYKPEWSKFPIAIVSPSLGRLSSFLKMASVIKKLNIRFYFRTDYENCYRDIRILSSLGYYCAVIINGKTVNWEELTDLMTYALLNVVNHREILPFSYVTRYYHPQNRTDYGAVYFDDASRYIHLTGEGMLALSRKQMNSVNGILLELDKLDRITQEKAYKEYLYRWQEFFLEPTPCACCKGWRICLGKYADTIKDNPGCRDFFSEFLEAVDLHLKKRENTTKEEFIWQP